jgi:hypothetical protein
MVDLRGEFEREETMCKYFLMGGALFDMVLFLIEMLINQNCFFSSLEILDCVTNNHHCAVSFSTINTSIKNFSVVTCQSSITDPIGISPLEEGDPVLARDIESWSRSMRRS